MNGKLLLEHFSRLSEAPDAIPRLRQFILDLAVRGKLVEQDPRDEPAWELLARIEREAKRKATRRASNRVEVAGGDDALYDLPATWVWTRIGDLARLENGDRSKNYPSKDQLVPKRIPFINAGHLRNGRVAIEGMNFISQERFELLRSGKVEEGDILYCLRGSLGKAAIVAGISQGAVASSLVIIRLAAEVSRAYILDYICSSLAAAMIKKYDNGTAQPNLSSADLGRFMVPLPPLAEQHRIVAKVDELMALCDRLEAAQAEREHRRDRLVAASLHRLNNPADPDAFRTAARFLVHHLAPVAVRAENVSQLRQAVVDMAVSGRLVHRVAGQKGMGEPIRGAREVSLDEVTLEFRYGTSAKCSVEPIGQAVLRIPNMDRGRVDISNLKYASLPVREAQDLRLRLDDILIVRSNGSLDLVGRPTLVEQHAVDFCFAGYLIRLRPDSRAVDPRYLMLALSSSRVRSQIELPIRTTVGLKNVNVTELARLTFPLPPLDEQRQIVQKVNEIAACAARIKEQLSAEGRTRHRVLEAVLARAVSPAFSDSL